MADETLIEIADCLQSIRRENIKLSNELKEIKLQLSSMDQKIDLLWGDLVSQSRYGYKKKISDKLSNEDIQTGINTWVKQISDVLGTHEGYILATDVYKILGVDRDPNLRTRETIYFIIRAMRYLGWEQKRFRDGRFYRWGYVKGDKRKHIYVFRDPITREITISNNPAFREKI